MTSYRTFSRLLFLTAVADVAVSGLAGCSAFTSGASGSGGGSSSGEPSARWQTTTTDGVVVGTWDYGGDLVVAGDRGITAFRQSDGKTAWRLAPPSGMAYCGGSTTVADGAVAVGVGAVLPGGRQVECHTVGVVDLRTGRPRWAQSVPQGDAQTAELQPSTRALAPHGITIGISGDTVIAAWQSVYAGFSLSSGTRRWSATVPGSGGNPNGATIYDVMPVGSLTYLPEQLLYQQVPTVLAIDTATGAVRATVTLPSSLTGIKSPGGMRMLGTSPATVLVRSDMSSASALVTLNSQFAPAQVIRSGSNTDNDLEPRHDLDLVKVAANPAVRGYSPVLEADGMIFAVTEPPDSAPVNTLVAYDASTGKRRWSAVLPGSDLVAPVAVDGSTLVADGIGQVTEGDPVVARLDLATGNGDLEHRHFHRGARPAGRHTRLLRVRHGRRHGVRGQLGRAGHRYRGAVRDRTRLARRRYRRLWMRG